MPRSLLVLLLIGCAHGPARPGDTPASYRSPEGYGETRWGMTPDEMKDQLANAEPLDSNSYRTHELVEGKPATLIYAFSNGHLASVTIQFVPPVGTPADFDQSYQSLAQRLGQPLPPPGARNQERDAALTAAAVVGALLVVGILVAIATKGQGGGLSHAGNGVHTVSAISRAVPPANIVHPVSPAWWIDIEALRATSEALEVGAIASEAAHSDHPLGGWMAEWRTPETDVILLGANLDWPGGHLVESYRSLSLTAPVPER